MHILLYAKEDDHHHCLTELKRLDPNRAHDIQLTCIDHYDGWIQILLSRCWDLVLVISAGAEGMEAVIAAKKLLPDQQVAWFSDDLHFGAQSYRLGCCYFGCKPVTKRKLAAALQSGTCANVQR